MWILDAISNFQCAAQKPNVLLLLLLAIVCFDSVNSKGHQLYSFGWNSAGQLGLGSTSSIFDTPTLLHGSSAPWAQDNITAIAAGGKHTLVLADGKLYAFGNNIYAQLGLNNTSPVYRSPQLLRGGSAPWGNDPITALAAGEYFSIVLAGGQLYAFGDNSISQLGITVPFQNVPALLSGASAPWPVRSVTAVDGGVFHTVAVAGAMVYTFGWNGYGQLGQDESIVVSRVPAVLNGSRAPWGSDVMLSVSSGGYHTTVLSRGLVYVFGWNNYGQLGLGSTSQWRSLATKLDGDSAPWGNQPVTLLAAGKYHTMMMAGGKLYATGYNYDGELGVGSSIGFLNVPQQVAGTNAPWGEDKITHVSAGGTATMVLAGGKVYGCGDNSFGQLGIQGVTGWFTSFQQLSYNGAPWRTNTASNLAVGGWHALVLGEPTPDPDCVDVPMWRDKNNFTCADYMYQGWCADWWYGDNWDQSWGPFSAYATGDSRVAADTACCLCGAAQLRKSHVNCTLGEWTDWGLCTADDSGSCWHTRMRPVLVLPNDMQPCAPVRERAECDSCAKCPVQEWGDWRCLALGFLVRTRGVDADLGLGKLPCPSLSSVKKEEKVCLDSPPLDTGFVLQTFGANEAAQLGFGDFDIRFLAEAAVEEPDDLPIQAISMGATTLGVLAEGLLYMVGYNAHGQLGLGDTTTLHRKLSMVPAPNGKRISSVVLGAEHSSFFTEDGTLYTFGIGAAGQLGHGSYADAYAPKSVDWAMIDRNTTIPMANISIRFVSLAVDYSTFLTTEGQLFTFGANSNGQLGLGEDRSWVQPVPRKVPFFEKNPVRTVSAGGQQCFCITEDLVLYATDGRGWTAVSPGVQHVAAGFAHTLFVTTDHQLYAFGNNDYGQLGLGTIGPYLFIPTLVSSLSGMAIHSIAAGYTHSAVLLTNSDLYTFGANSDGQLGIGEGVQLQPTPTLVAPGGYNGPIHSITLGGWHTGVLRSPSPTPTLTITPKRTHSSTMTTTQTGTSSSSASPTNSNSNSMTQTTILTSSLSIPYCSEPNVSISKKSWTLSSSVRCTLPLVAGEGSSQWYSRQLVLQISSLPATLAAHVYSGCASLNANCPFCDECMFSFSPRDNPATHKIPLGPATEVSFSLLYGTYDDGSLRSGATSVDVKLSAGYTATPLLLGLLLGLCTGAIILVCILVLGFLLRYLKKRQNSFVLVYLGVATRTSRWIHASALVFFLVGLSWCIIVVTTSYPDPEPLSVLIAGAVLSGIAFLILLAAVLKILRDPVQYVCPACSMPVSPWRFAGTYLRDPLDGTIHGKAHTAHIACMVCKLPVVNDGWSEASPQRPYHMVCWDQNCTLLLKGDSGTIQRWHADAQPPVTSTELAYLLIAAVRVPSVSCIAELLDIQSSLPSIPLAEEGGRTALHLAARSGNLRVLIMLLNADPEYLDPVCAIDPGAPRSIVLKGLDRQSDVYICHAQLRLNGRPVYIGLTRGNYLYCFRGTNSITAGVKPATGWCISTQLGSSQPTLRIPLPDPPCPIRSPGSQKKANGKKMHTRLAGLVQTFHKSIWDTLHHDELQSEEESFPERSSSHSGSQVALLSCSFAERPQSPDGDEGIEESDHVPVVQVEWLPHSVSLLEEAISSGNHQVIRHVLQLYKAQHPACMVWQHHLGDGLWETYSSKGQAAIAQALERGEAGAILSEDDFVDGLINVDFNAMLHHGQTTEKVRNYLRPIFQYRRSPAEPFEITCDIHSILNWSNAIVVFSPSCAAAAAPDEETLTLLVDEGVVDMYALPPPSSAAENSPVVVKTQLEAVCRDLLHRNVVQTMGLSVKAAIVELDGLRRKGSKGHQGRNGRNAETGIGNRLTGGLQEHQSHETVAFYSSGYTSPIGALPFCAQLPRNSHGLLFEMEPLAEMTGDALTKLAEMQRQHFALSARHIISIFVYSYELSYEDSGYDQIYDQMNKAMRHRDTPLITFWRPLIWMVDMALYALPTFHGKCFRGINCQLSPSEYEVGSTICWSAFSSASQARRVAEEFAKGSAGTLFFLTSCAARPISAISRFPEEAEVLFPSNSLFQVSSTLFGSSDIAAFYGRVDNIAMTQTYTQLMGLSAVMTDDHVQVAGHSSFLLHIPEDMSHHVLQLLASTGIHLLEPGVPTEANVLTQLLYVPDSPRRSARDVPLDLIYPMPSF